MFFNENPTKFDFWIGWALGAFTMLLACATIGLLDMWGYL